MGEEMRESHNYSGSPSVVTGDQDLLEFLLLASSTDRSGRPFPLSSVVSPSRPSCRLRLGSGPELGWTGLGPVGLV